MTRDEIKMQILDLGSDEINAFRGKFEGGIHLQQIPEEITDLVIFLQSHKPVVNNYLEVGAAGGGNCFVLNKYLKINNNVIVDNNLHSKYIYRKDILKDLLVTEVIGNSQSDKIIDEVKSLNLSFDIIFIDADHSYEGVTKDTHNYEQFLTKEGILIYHDSVECEGVRRHLQDLENKGYKRVFYTDIKLGISVYARPQ
jgi:predicted O-methyltransferase YrrM